MARERPLAPLAIAALGTAAAAGVLIWAVVQAQRPRPGPAPVRWDHVACARCRMLIGDPAFAAQLHLRSGELRLFDDPGCLLIHLEEAEPEVHALYFHHLEQERWLREAEVAFVPGRASPMGYGLGAVERGRPGALSLEEAAARAWEREQARSGG